MRSSSPCPPRRCSGNSSRPRERGGQDRRRAADALGWSARAVSETVTRGVRIIADPRFLPEQSDTEQNLFVFVYHITIRNEGAQTVQLLSRHWVITNGEGAVEEVRGPGVVGYQPTIRPGEQFQYTSGCPLNTPVGTMHGSFTMVTADGDAFDARIQPFRLTVPYALN